MHEQQPEPERTDLMGAGNQRWWRDPAVLEAEQRVWLACENVRVLHAITATPSPSPAGWIRAWLDALRVLVDLVVHGIAPVQVWIPREVKFSSAQATLILEHAHQRAQRVKRACQKAPRRSRS